MPSMTTPGRAVSWVSNWMLVRVREVAELGGKEKTPPAKSGGMVVRGTPKHTALFTAVDNAFRKMFTLWALQLTNDC